MEIKVPDIILTTLNLELTLKHIKDLCTFFCQIWICIESHWNMFYIHDNIFVCSHVLTRIVDKYVPITHHYRFSIGDFNCLCGIAKCLL